MTKSIITSKSKRVKKMPADYHALAEMRGFTWLGPEVPTTKTKTNWLCSRGHLLFVEYHALTAKRSCQECRKIELSERFRTGPYEYAKLARDRGFIWLGPAVEHSRQRTRWQCAIGHIWENTFGHIKRGQGCPICANRVPKSPEYYHRVAKHAGLEWLGPVVFSVNKKTQWRCPMGHIWDANCATIARGHGCPYCAGLARKTPEDFHALAAQRNYEWIGIGLPNASTKTLWRCDRGHKWETTYDTIRDGHGCPICGDRVNGLLVSSQQRKIAEMIDGELNYRIGRSGIDIALVEQRVAIEYDAWYWHKGKSERDRRQTKRFHDAGWKVIRVKSNNKIPSLAQLHSAIDLLNSELVYTEIILDDWFGEL